MRRLLLAALGATALAIGACGGGNGSSGGSTAPTTQPSASASTVTFTETEFKIDTASTTLKAGDYTFQVDNKGQFPHDLHIATPDGSEIAKTDVINAGSSATVQVSLKAGTYTIWCAVDAHKARGMQGTLTVT
ncbi:MAG TPA: cupredoxin domain-containing protein [Candidatus Dormibacteraeota bacterium]|nr:cupredoxin domain-containing protein [Candidatus Dormibacteraeota bacterium]